MRAAVVGLALALAACSSAGAGDRAAEEFAIVSETGDANAKCRAAEKARDAYLSDRNQEKYESWSADARIYCLSAELAR